MSVELNFPKLTNKAYYPLYKNKKRYLVLYGGAGSGKSVFAAQKLIKRMLMEKNHKILVVRKVAKTLRNSTFSLLRETIAQWGISEVFEFNKTEMEITCKNGNRILHAGLDDVEKIKSIHGITALWIEEASELTREDFQQLDLRLRGETGSYKQIILTFNPVAITHWLKKFIDTGRNVKALKTTYKDNKWIDDAYIQTIEDLKDADPYYYTVYGLGEWGILGKTIFHAEAISNRLSVIRKKKPRKGYFYYDYHFERVIDSLIKFIEADDGYIEIFSEPKIGHPYVIGGDTAGDGSDKFAAQVLDNSTGEQVAVLHHQFDEDLYTKQIYCLGRHYNSALIGIETNYSTYPVKELERLGYMRQYEREVPDTFTGKTKKSFGFQTNRMTRPLIISNGVEVVRENVGVVNHVGTLEEMTTFVRNAQGRAEAQEGSHDDLIMAWLIALQIRDQQTKEVRINEAFDPDDDEDEDDCRWERGEYIFFN